MTTRNGSNAPPAKRRKLDDASNGDIESSSKTSTSLSRPVSPPAFRRKAPIPTPVPALLQGSAPTWSFDDVPKQTSTPPLQPPPLYKPTNQIIANSSDRLEQTKGEISTQDASRHVASPFQLTKIRDLAPHQNVDTVELRDILGDPMIKECWNFNFLFDLDFVM